MRYDDKARPYLKSALVVMKELRDLALSRGPTADEEEYWAMMQSADITIEEVEGILGRSKRNESEVREDIKRDGGDDIKELVEILSGKIPLA